MRRVSVTTRTPGRHLPRLLLGLCRHRYMTAYCMIAPALALYALFVLYPIGQGIWLSLYAWDGFSAMQWAGLQNYRFVLDDRIFWLALQHTLLFAVVVTFAKNALGLLLAVLLNRPLRGRALFRVAAFLPVTMAFVAIGVLWSWIYNPTFGLLNNVLRGIGLGVLIQGWLSDPQLALWSIMVVDIWKWAGFHMLLFLAGLQSIPHDLYEAARIDGATGRQRFVRITLPLLRQIAAVSVTLAFVGGLASNYDVVYVMTGGGPYHATEVASTWIATTAFRFGSFGKASAMTVILFGIVFAIAMLQLVVLTQQHTLE